MLSRGKLVWISMAQRATVEFVDDVERAKATSRPQETAKRLLEPVQAVLKDPLDGIGNPSH